MKYQIPRGTRDILTNETPKWRYIERVFLSVCELYNYKEVRIPIFEHAELFIRDGNDSSDMVTKEMYIFEDKKNRKMALRPEFTAGIARAYIENKLYGDVNQPQKLFYMGPAFRYERPQKGRYRQFQQIGLECIGSESVVSDIEVIDLSMSVIDLLQIDNSMVKINYLGKENTRKRYTDALKEYLSIHLDSLCDDCKNRYYKNPLRILDCKIDAGSEVFVNAPKLSDFYDVEDKKYVEELINCLDGIQINYEIDEYLIRGLDYYTGVVFEFVRVDDKGKQSFALGGGGRYQNMIKEMGGPDTTCVGMSLGMDRLVEIKDELDGFIELEKDVIDVYIINNDIENINDSYNLARMLRLNGFKCELDMLNRSVKAQYKDAERKNSRFYLTINEDKLQLKNSVTKEVVELDFENLIDYLDSNVMDEGGEHHE